MIKRKVHRAIENLVDDDGHVTHVKCTECCWKMSVREAYDKDEVPEEIQQAFSTHNCDDHRIGAGFRKA
jgi:hypothetical protein